MPLGVTVVLFSLAGIPIAGFILIKIWKKMYPPEQILEEISRELGEHGEEISLCYQWRRHEGKETDEFDFEYELPLPPQAQELNLVARESVEEPEELVQLELELPDEDFQDYFCLESVPPDWLTPERCAILLELFEKHHATWIKNGRLKGRLKTYSTPGTAGRLSEKLRKMKLLVDDLPAPSGQCRVRPRGWVAARLRLTRGSKTCILGALVTTFSAIAVWGLPSLFYCRLLSGSFLVAGLGALFCGLAVISGSHWALPLGRVAQIAAAVGVAALIPLGLLVGRVPGLIVVASISVVLWLWLISAYNALARVPLRKENRAGLHRLG